jgi:hypothetical protein
MASILTDLIAGQLDTSSIQMILMFAVAAILIVLVRGWSEDRDRAKTMETKIAELEHANQTRLTRADVELICHAHTTSLFTRLSRVIEKTRQECGNAKREELELLFGIFQNHLEDELSESTKSFDPASLMDKE